MRCGRYLALERLSHPDRAPHPLPRAARQVALRTVCPGWKERYDAASKAIETIQDGPHRIEELNRKIESYEKALTESDPERLRDIDEPSDGTLEEHGARGLEKKRDELAAAVEEAKKWVDKSCKNGDGKGESVHTCAERVASEPCINTVVDFAATQGIGEWMDGGDIAKLCESESCDRSKGEIETLNSMYNAWGEAKGRVARLSTSEPFFHNVVDYAGNQGVGEWGGECTCPDGMVYQVGDIKTLRETMYMGLDPPEFFKPRVYSGFDRTYTKLPEEFWQKVDKDDGHVTACGSLSYQGLACHNGKSGGCHGEKGPWSYRKVECKPGAATHTFNADISKWDVSAGTDFSSMFEGARLFNGDLSKWNTARAKDFMHMFKDAAAFNGDLSAWNTGEARRFYGMFDGAEAFNGDISKWNVANVDKVQFTGQAQPGFSTMFHGATTFNSDLSGWDVSGAKEFTYMFNKAKAFNQDLGKWNTAEATTFMGMFENAEAFNGDISKWDVASGTSFFGMFDGDSSFYPAPPIDQDLSKWDLSKGTEESFLAMFAIRNKVSKVNRCNMIKAWSSYDAFTRADHHLGNCETTPDEKAVAEGGGAEVTASVTTPITDKEIADKLKQEMTALEEKLDKEKQQQEEQRKVLEEKEAEEAEKRREQREAKEAEERRIAKEAEEANEAEKAKEAETISKESARTMETSSHDAGNDDPYRVNIQKGVTTGFKW